MSNTGLHQFIGKVYIHYIKVVVYSMNDNYHVFSKIHKNFKKYVS